MQAPLADLGDGAQVLEPRALLAEGEPAPVRRTLGQPQPVGQRPLLDRLRPVGRLDARTPTESRIQPEVSAYRLW